MAIIRLTTEQANKQFGSIFKTPKKNKFGAKKVVIDNMKFDSKSEGDVYYDLKLQERQGLIESFETQVKESFEAYGKHICNYYVDFKVYHNDGKIEFLEHKGIATPLFNVKWKLMLAKYDQDIRDNKVICSINWYNKGKKTYGKRNLTLKK